MKLRIWLHEVVRECVDLLWGILVVETVSAGTETGETDIRAVAYDAASTPGGNSHGKVPIATIIGAGSPG